MEYYINRKYSRRVQFSEGNILVLITKHLSGDELGVSNYHTLLRLILDTMEFGDVIHQTSGPNRNFFLVPSKLRISFYNEGRTLKVDSKYGYLKEYHFSHILNEEERRLFRERLIDFFTKC
jgi:hypothetical protein